MDVSCVQIWKMTWLSWKRPIPQVRDHGQVDFDVDVNLDVNVHSSANASSSSSFRGGSSAATRHRKMETRRIGCFSKVNFGFGCSESRCRCRRGCHYYYYNRSPSLDGWA